MDDFTNGLSELLGIVPAWLNAALAIVGAASAVTALIPGDTDDRWLAKLRRLLEVLALNIGHARPASAKNEPR